MHHSNAAHRPCLVAADLRRAPHLRPDQPKLVNPLVSPLACDGPPRCTLAAAAAVNQGRPDAVLAQCPVSAAVVRWKCASDWACTFPVVMACHFNYSEAKEYRDKGELADEASYQEIHQFRPASTLLGEV